MPALSSSQETIGSIAQQVKIDAAKCMAMPAAEFETTALRGVEASKAFVKKLAE